MASPNILHNAYTDAPQQHPNLILGSLQLLFWLFFRPAAWRNHLKRIDPTLNTDTSLIAFIRQGRSRNFALWRLLIQGYLILPILANLLLGLVLWVLGEPIATIVDRVVESIAKGVVVGMVVCVAIGAKESAAKGVAFGMAFAVAFGMANAVVITVGKGVEFAVSKGMDKGIAFSVAFGVVEGAAVTINLWRSILSFPFLAAWNYLLYILDKRRNANSPCLFRYHSAFWDECPRLHLFGLDEYLLFVIEHNPVEGKAALKYLSSSRQRWAVQAAQIELDARSLERCVDVEAIRQAHRNLITGELDSPVSTLLNIFNDISKDVDAALNLRSFYSQRKVLSAVAERLDTNLQEISTSKNEYSFRFYPIAQSWLKIITNYIDELVKATELRQEIDNPYIIGVPLNEQLEIFTGRTSIGLRIEQLLLDHRRPPLLLYGQRRMGKTSLLNNLGKLLPNTIIPMFVDLQGAPSSASDHAGFLYNLARSMLKAAKQQGVLLPPLTREALTSDPFTSFDEWLDTVEQTLEQNIALLMLDEFEVLDSAITKGRFDEQDVLGMLRHLIQHRPRFKVLLAGSHTIAEYQRWASYLINVQVVHISYLKEAEARQLIERPVKNFTLRYEPDVVERVLQLTRCHPCLVQLLCGEIIALKNEQDPSVRRLATLSDVEAAIPEAFKSGGFFFADIQNNQVDDNGRAILRFIAAQGERAMVNIQAISQQFPHADSTLKLLLQRELIEEIGQNYCFGVELIRRWFTL
ncbi:MAG: ATP-binding protein [Aulosira sp. DedQUE10]|nr:ATP-binding protein [Aulosira sp. DedQUE10]